ncbi:MAG TPA: hypothetical protein DC049_04800 [Spirochaetia bacterium]|nr:hypothetical protein [Spirochaetia bacterium]
MHGYILSNHCKEMLVERNIKGNWVEETVTDPQKKENQEDDTVHYFKRISEYENRVLHVVVNSYKSPKIIVTAFFDRKAGRSL